MSLLALFSAVGIVLSGCSVISSDVARFDLDLPSKSFSVDANGWPIPQAAAQTYLGMQCGASPDVCSSAVQKLCPTNCSGTCNSASLTCDLELDIAVHQGVDLVAEKPELSNVTDQPVLRVTVDSVTYEVTANTLSTETPAMKVYLAPKSVIDASDPAAKHVATIPPIPAKTTVVATQMEYTTAGKRALIDAMGNFKTPFNIIVASAIEVTAGGAVPTGKLDANVHIRAHASL